MRYERQDTDTPLQSVEQVAEEKSKKKVHVKHLFYKVTDSSFWIVLFDVTFWRVILIQPVHF